ncbi:uracil-xanthine permease family protein [Boudabousia marimammalium]|uniref:Nitrate reductase n=1 Tax=Boudabousia marimammalium TaxID=156892 RepID=A0A1Q5PSX5_9ACTO|nr:solute carrier family 23 protein [Boudabousia marimammalium]OKL50643.1 nitrate reductase [Boudabousia marimammalium]
MSAQSAKQPETADSVRGRGGAPATPSQKRNLFKWAVHGDGKTINPGTVVMPHERLTWPRTIGIGMQHVVAMFGATFLIPLMTGFPPSTTLLFSGLGTLLFLILTRGRVPSYLGSSIAAVAPMLVLRDTLGPSYALGGLVMVGVMLSLVGLLVHFAGAGWIHRLMPPLITGTIVAFIGFNLAPLAWLWVKEAPFTAFITIVTVLFVSVFFRGLIGRLSILVGVVVGSLVAYGQGEVDLSGVYAAAWFGLPEFMAPSFAWSTMGMFLPAVLVLVAENIGHVKSVSAMTGEDLDDMAGRALFADGVATVIAGSAGGSGTTTYAENIGVMATTRVYSTAAYFVAAVFAMALSLMPKFGALIGAIPLGVLGGAGTILYGMIGMLGVRIWVENKVDFADPVNLNTAAVAMIIAIADFTLKISHINLGFVSFSFTEVQFGGVALGTIAALVTYHVTRWIVKKRGTGIPDPLM